MDFAEAAVIVKKMGWFGNNATNVGYNLVTTLAFGRSVGSVSSPFFVTRAFGGVVPSPRCWLHSSSLSSSSSSSVVGKDKDIRRRSDYVPYYRQEHIPYTGRRVEGRWPYPFASPDGYRTNHDFYGLSGLFKSIFFNKEEWGGQYYYLKRGLIVMGKVGGLFILLNYVVDPYGIRSVKRRVAAKRQQHT